MLLNTKPKNCNLPVIKECTGLYHFFLVPLFYIGLNVELYELFGRKDVRSGIIVKENVFPFVSKRRPNSLQILMRVVNLLTLLLRFAWI